jgi:hypothetical protein
MKLAKQNGLNAAAGAAARGIEKRRTGFQYYDRSAAWKAPVDWVVDAEAASITTLLRNQQFDFGYHNKMHRKLQ